MPPKVTPEKVEKFKNRCVSSPLNEADQLPDDLKELWDKEEYVKFLENALEKLKNLVSNLKINIT